MNDIEAIVRRLLRGVWDRFEAALDNRAGRLALTNISRVAIRLQYRQRCRVRHADGVWEYHWPDTVVMSDRPLVCRARPEQIGRLSRQTIFDNWLWAYRPGPGDVAVDVGAGIGEELYDLVDLVGPDGDVYAIEAHPRLCEVVRRLKAANNWPRVHVLNYAVADKHGSVMLTDDRHSTIGNDIFRAGSIEIEAMPLAELLADLDRVDFLKLNIEGAEFLALEGLGDVRPRHIAVSCHDFIGRPTKSVVRQWLDEHGYRVREHPNPAAASGRDFLYAERGDV